MPKYFVNSTDHLTQEALTGFARAHPETVVWHEDEGYLSAVERAPGRRTGLVSGGGSGHEPLHVGFVGRGMLDAACPGQIFASPHNRQIFAASRAVAGPEGVLHLVKNYTGDKINFGIAAERLAREGIRCARVLIDDDLATESEEVAVGRRGTGATVLVEKILGAAADTGMGLDELAALGEDLVGRSRSLAVAGAAHTTPETGLPAFELERSDLEYGVGIHGERARSTVAQPPVKELVAGMSRSLLESLGVGAGDSVIVLVNGLGAVTSLELYTVYAEVTDVLAEAGVHADRSLVGDYVTALDMRGFSLTFLRSDPRTVGHFDAPARTAAW
ncbi:dihydroxyacetone kinase subunit DhaK [Streptomyces sp. NPDC049954]|uniref:dihydroxyacetone kinase subunit DhaK n=1 Tax=Streptomyces sp. NPDC049954 TaxID=3155779 RepID=UPI00343287A2